MRVTSTQWRHAASERTADSKSKGQEGSGALHAETLEQSVLRSLDRYFADLDGARPHALHELVMQAVERPLLKFAVDRCAGNQSAAADLLGINRNTLRRKLVDYGLL
ncbi:MAG: DNA-binding protein [Burkholderiaceae bacterium]|nr:DNA-binding protein [Burkholderiaceae bacterium]